MEKGNPADDSRGGRVSKTKTPEYKQVVKQGYKDYVLGRRNCPYMSQGEANGNWARQAWWDGWLQADAERKFPHLFGDKSS